jgi:riboflavin biosynthesis pyrimidine reductase
MTPHVTCLMISSLDGRLHPSRYTASPDGTRTDWSAVYEEVSDAAAADGWLVGRVTMAEMSKAAAHPPASPGAVERPVHVAAEAESHAVALDPSGKLHFDGGTVGGDHVVVLLGRDVPDSHLAELAADGVSYIVATGDGIDLSVVLATLGERFGIRRLLLEGGGGTNGAFLAAGLVDAFEVLIAPALDGEKDVQGIVTYGDGLAGLTRLRLTGVETLRHGIVHLRYAVEATE